MNIITQPMGQLLDYIYNNLAFKSYGIAIIIFTIIIRVILLPLMVKQYHSMSRIQELNPKIQEIQKRYKNDKEKLNQELMKIYQENNVNPASGCLPLLIQLPILFGLWQVISKPLTYMLNLHDKVDALAKALSITAKSSGGYQEIGIINSFVGEKVNGILSSDVINTISQMKKGFMFPSSNFGINLGLKPSLAFSDFKSYFILLLIPLIAVVTQYISAKIMTPKTSQGADNPMQKSMMFMAPMMTLIFSFNFPAGLGIYWITGNVFQIFQQMFINRLILKKKEVQTK